MSFHQVVKQRTPADCGVATLAMLLSDRGITYEDVVAAVTEVAPKVFNRGLWLPEIIKAAKRLGVTLRQRRSYVLEDVERGILRVTWKDKGGAHVVFIRDGQVTDTDGMIWDPDVYLSVNGAIPRALLVIH
jgi:ABC-type bacteriocin/lantibiotic exporter with double-glycine peptidase domain